MNKEEVSSPKVLLESVKLTEVIDAHKQREVAIVDIPNEGIHTKNPKKMEHQRDIIKNNRETGAYPSGYRYISLWT